MSPFWHRKQLHRVSIMIFCSFTVQGVQK
jgi:hypothetical protein